MRPFRARGDKPKEIFRGVQRLEGKQAVATEHGPGIK